MVLAKFFQRDVVGFLSGAGRFVLKSLDNGIRTILGTSAREFLSFCEIANLPDLSVGELTASTALSEMSTLKPFCLVLLSPMVLTGLFPGGFDPSYLSFPKVCLAMVVCCISPCVHWPVFCTRGAPVFTWPVSCFSVFFSPLVTASIHHASWWCCSSGNALCFCVPGNTFLFSGMRWVWHLENYCLFLSSVSHDGLSGAAPLV